MARPEIRGRAAVFLAFLITRLVLLSIAPPQSTLLGVNVQYAFEVQRAASLGMSFYKVHELNRADEDPKASQAERQVEYPPLAILWMTAPTWFLDPLPRTGLAPPALLNAARQANRVLMFLVDLSGFAILWWLGAAAAPLAIYVACGALLFPLLYDRMDLLLGVLLLAALAARLRKWPDWISLALLAVAINFKLTPLVLSPLFVLGGSWKQVARRAAVLAAFTIGIFLPFFLRDGVATLGFLQYHTGRGLQLESIWSTLPDTLAALFLVPTQIVQRYGAFEVLSALTPLLTVLSSIAMLAVIPWAAFVGRASKPEQLSVIFLLAAILSSKVFSPQYLLWIVPLIVLWDGKGTRWVWAGFLAVCLLTTLCYPFGYGRLMAAVAQPDTLSVGARLAGITPLLLRNLLLIALTILCWRSREPVAPVESTPAAATRPVPVKKRPRGR